ncbi:hypothetical protein B0H63DRAFT_517091 [Podospora didyma]|uniref:Uncharacterized protein n=1 Tax=Podospora didyma TaxID=330526 RepID=A0AAE0P5T0_9PEZI|nr:hypothetical protein B0H63DRAFT_517091 [Podospora didyma]
MTLQHGPNPPAATSDSTTALTLWLEEPNAPINHTLLSTSSLENRQADTLECLARLEAAFPPRTNHNGPSENNGKGIATPAAPLQAKLVDHIVGVRLRVGDESDEQVNSFLDDSDLSGLPRLLSTWLEFSWDKQGWIWGDVSPIRGCDGAVRIAKNAYIDDAHGNSVIASHNGRFGSERHAGRP